MKLTRLALLLPALLLVSCVTPSIKKFPASPTVTAETYNKNKAVVLIAVNWDRHWGCGVYENAQLKGIRFDHLPLSPNSNTTNDLTLNASGIFSSGVFTNYAFVVTPGEYALSGFDIKTAISMNQVNYLSRTRATLFDQNLPIGGTFTANAGEIVYIGSFGLDCYEHPIPWRFYTKKENFPQHLAQFKQLYPFLDIDKAVYRLFETKTYGQDYQ